MRYQNLLVTLSVLSTLLLSKPAIAHSVLEKVVNTGVLTVGTSKDAFPFAYTDKNGRLTGYSIDMSILIQKQVEKELKRPIKLDLIPLDPGDRIPKLRSGAVDMVCDAASFTWERERDVDFTVSYGTTGTQLLTRRGQRGKQSWDAAALSGRRIGALAGTTNEQSIRRFQPKAQIVLVKDRAAGYKSLRENKIDAFADDGILLEAWLQRTANTQKFEIVSKLFSQEGIACMVPENNSTFLDVANYALIRFMQGFLKGKQPYVQTFDRWFGARSVIPVSKDLRELIIENMRLTIDAKQEVPENEL
ncbi:periplasmic component of amino acid ABC-type transporter/signal transduction system [Chamaesiphon minutus PCC 6605]|uniref:Periplasmic component of amino acid ABC-type transporter/signal transduction system n=1 Tax=Chamaesiphon minutus (strain ATCC 27169 / PCC 6605) TaxID=1173020 RepID=K9UCF2_CHAP6|nr:periplasmic component of amino acid ABC-type transporter/signal transduction system [Chamaesiphon minutus PCC 6605]